MVKQFLFARAGTLDIDRGEDAAINQTALKQLKESALKAKEPEAARIGEPPANLDTGAAAEDWLKSQIGTADPKINDFLKRFRDFAQSISKESFDRARARFKHRPLISHCRTLI